jgi:hypothetical protein
VLASAAMREIFAVLVLVGSACSSAPSDTVAATSTGGGTSTGLPMDGTSSSGDRTTGVSVSSSSDAASDTMAPDVPESEPDTDTDAEPPGASDYCESIVDSFCEFYLRCGRMDVDSVEACRDPFLESCNAVFEPQYAALEAAGLLSLSARGLAACEAHLADVACEQQVFELAGPCSGLWEGTQAAGQPCGLDVEFYVCEPSAACTIGLDFCGTCETVLEPRDDCSVEGVTCGPDGFCDDGACRDRVPNGGACSREDRCMAGSACIDATCQGPSFVGEGDACDSTRRCPYLTTCIGGVCSPTARIGEACSAATPCDAGTCEAGTCVAPRDDGEACDGNGGCSSGMCIDGTCAPRPSGCISG